MSSYVKKTVNMDSELVAWIDKQIKNHQFASVTHAVNKAIYEMKERTENTNQNHIFI